MSLVTSKRLSRHAWTEVPMPNAVIAAVERMAELKEQPLIEGGLPLFEWGPNIPIQDAINDVVGLQSHIHWKIVFAVRRDQH